MRAPIWQTASALHCIMLGVWLLLASCNTQIYHVAQCWIANLQAFPICITAATPFIKPDSCILHFPKPHPALAVPDVYIPILSLSACQRTTF